jgi:hypothetical protein
MSPMEWGSIPQAAEMLGVSANTMKEILARHRKDIRAIVPNRQVRVNLFDVENYREARSCGRKRRRNLEPVEDILSD